MNVNRCPVCSKLAMTNWSKFAGKTLSCAHCHAKLRMAIRPTLILAFVVLAISLLAVSILGLSAGTAAIVFGALAIFAVCGFFIPLEECDE